MFQIWGFFFFTKTVSPIWCREQMRFADKESTSYFSTDLASSFSLFHKIHVVPVNFFHEETDLIIILSTVSLTSGLFSLYSNISYSNFVVVHL